MSNATTSGCFLEIPLMKQHGSSLIDAQKPSSTTQTYALSVSLISLLVKKGFKPEFQVKNSPKHIRVVLALYAAEPSLAVAVKNV